MSRSKSGNADQGRWYQGVGVPALRPPETRKGHRRTPGSTVQHLGLDRLPVFPNRLESVPFLQQLGELVAKYGHLTELLNGKRGELNTRST